MWFQVVVCVSEVHKTPNDETRRVGLVVALLPRGFFLSSGCFLVVSHVPGYSSWSRLLQHKGDDEAVASIISR